jgi:predicted Zn-dependent protease
MRAVHRRVPILSAVSLFVLFVSVGGIAQGPQSCSVTVALRVPTAANIFSAQQERALGDIEAESVESNYRAAHDDELAAHLNAVAGRVLSQSPRGQALVHVILIDTPETESFSVAPERIYIKQKMVALLRNDGELAGLLGVNVVSGRKDVSEKSTRMFSSIERDTKLSRKAASIIGRQEGIHQNQADCVALFASAAAGLFAAGICGTF